GLGEQVGQLAPQRVERPRGSGVWVYAKGEEWSQPARLDATALGGQQPLEVGDDLFSAFEALGCVGAREDLFGVEVDEVLEILVAADVRVDVWVEEPHAAVTRALVTAQNVGRSRASARTRGSSPSDSSAAVMAALSRPKTPERALGNVLRRRPNAAL